MLLFFFLTPLFFILFGGYVGIIYFDTFSFWRLALLYIGVITSELSAAFLSNVLLHEQKYKRAPFFILQGVFLLLLIFLYWKYSLWAAAGFFFYHMLRQMLILFHFYPLNFCATLLQTLLHPLFLNAFAFYLQLHFISWSIMRYFLPLFILYFFVAATYWNFSLTRTYSLLLYLAFALITYGVVASATLQTGIIIVTLSIFLWGLQCIRSTPLTSQCIFGIGSLLYLFLIQ